HIFEPHEMLPAAGQGALGIEVRSTRPEVSAALAPLAHRATWLAVAAERAVSRAMGGSCSMPLAAFATWQSAEVLRLEAAWGDPEGRVPVVRVHAETAVTSLEAAVALGEQVAALLRQAGAVGAA
ncbi:MAG TPA: hydroxymethylbilane synthase, partial [Macromonas sp.]|nr:hydroxymethylbilane synthase [Macromonas sp.]